MRNPRRMGRHGGRGAAGPRGCMLHPYTREASMSAIVVHPTDPQADAASLTRALNAARVGDIVLVGPGSYSPTHTGETLPLRIPAGVAVEGAGKDVCVIDGEGLFEPSFNPIQADLSVVVLEEGASLSGVAVTNGGWAGIGIPPWGSAP